MQADETFADPKVEGTFITSESRAKAHEYIKEQIKSYESIIRYYKNRQNTLTITCRIPPEVLACIFRYFVKDAVGDNADPDTHSKKIDWIRAVSHICSHWREVALSTPSLWSTIDLGYAPAFALEMLQRSKNVPLSVINAGDVSRKAFPVLVHILDSHLPRIKDLLLEHDTFSRDLTPKITSNNYRALLSLLGQHDSPKMERLALRTVTYRDEAVQLPHKIVTRSASLKHLVLEGYGIDWELSPAFESLKLLTIRRIPKDLKPSMVQLLGFISRLPLLETLAVADIDNREGTLPSKMDHIRVEHLENLNVSFHSPSVINSFLDRLTLPKDGISTVGVGPFYELSGPHPALQELSQRLDDITDGPVLHLKLSFHKIECWKHKQKRSEGGAPTIEVILPALRNLGEVQVQVLQSLRLDQVVSLEVNGNECHERVWSLIGNLPQLEELQVYRRYTQTIVETLLQPKTDIQDTTDLSFPALTVLGINDCHFYDHESDMGRLYDSIELRRDAELPLKRLTISNCDGMLYGQLDDLEQIIDEVIWDQSGAIDNEDEDMYF